MVVLLFLLRRRVVRLPDCCSLCCADGKVFPNYAPNCFPFRTIKNMWALLLLPPPIDDIRSPIHTSLESTTLYYRVRLNLKQSSWSQLQICRDGLKVAQTSPLGESLLYWQFLPPQHGIMHQYTPVSGLLLSGLRESYSLANGGALNKKRHQMNTLGGGAW